MIITAGLDRVTARKLPTVLNEKITDLCQDWIEMEIKILEDTRIYFLEPEYLKILESMTVTGLPKYSERILTSTKKMNYVPYFMSSRNSPKKILIELGFQSVIRCLQR